MVDAAAVAPYVVVFANLNPRAKAQYTKFLLENDVKFHQHPTSKMFVANIRLEKSSVVDSNQQESGNQEPKQDESFNADLVDKRLAAVPEALRAYANFILLIGERPMRSSTDQSVCVKETQLVRFINEVYDALHEDLTTLNTNNCDTFAKFVQHYLKNRFGLKPLVDQHAWSLIDGLSALHHRVDVRLFSCFLQGKYPERTLAFFLYARSHLQCLVNAPAFQRIPVKISSVTARKRKAATATSRHFVWLSRAQVETLAETVFGSKAEVMYIEFMQAMRTFLSCDSSVVRPRIPSFLLDTNEFLFIATETYHKASATICEPSCGESAHASPDHQLLAFDAVQKKTSALLQSTLAAADSRQCHFNMLSDAEAGDTNYAVETDLQSRLDSLLERVKKRQQRSEL